MSESMETLLFQLRSSREVLPKFWSAVVLSSPGADGGGGDLSLAREQYDEFWPHIKQLFVLHMALIEGVDDWGLLGLEVEASVRARVVLQAADEQALQPGMGWPPAFRGGFARAPRDMINVGSTISARLGLDLGSPTYGLWNPAVWATATTKLVTGVGGGPATFHADARWRRARLQCLDAAVQLWVAQGPVRTPGDLLWRTLSDDGLEYFLSDGGVSLFSQDEVEPQLRGAVKLAHQIGAGDITAEAQWLAALRLALRGEMALNAADMMSDLRPWSHDDLFAWLQTFLTS